jgi:putative ABC transport system substrate-binding protein
VKRREFITLVVGAASTWPVAVHAQQVDRMRRIAALMAIPASDPDATLRKDAFEQGLQKLGWTSRNLRIDYRWTAPNIDRIGAYAGELVDLAPDVLLAHSPPVLAALQEKKTHTIPIVFVGGAA